MREIKFRAWLKETQEMIEAYNLSWGYSINPDTGDNIHNINSQWKVGRDAILMQYTGLKDKNGKEIYEGDIVRVLNNLKEYECGEVAMGNLGTWAVRLHQLKIPIFEFIDDRLSLVHSMDRIEVIGNIYENPELLEVE